jgi:hypothetical protein
MRKVERKNEEVRKIMNSQKLLAIHSADEEEIILRIQERVNRFGPLPDAAGLNTRSRAEGLTRR